MNTDRLNAPAPISAPEEVNALRVRFEEALRRGDAGALDDWLPVAETARAAVLEELAVAELRHRRQAGLTATADDYLVRYPALRENPSAAARLHAAESESPALTCPPTPAAASGEADGTPLTEVASQDALAAARARSAAAAPAVVQIAGYEILATLGRGGMGIVYKARQINLDRIVALKMVLAGAQADTRRRTRFRIEAEAVARLQHPHIVQIYEVGESEGRPYFSLEFVDGGCLTSRLGGDPWPARTAAGLVRSLAQAMHYAHQRGVLHRDLKPANVLLTQAGVPKVTDFGLAKQLDEDAGLSRSGDIMGTPSYMAPEQADGRIRDLGPWTDVYALGAILYEVLTGRPPFKGESVMATLEQVRRRDPTPPRQVRAQVPFDLETICLKCLRKDTARRYQAAADLAADLDRYIGGEPILARPVGPLERAVKWARRRPTAATLLGVVALALGAAAAAVPWHIATLHAEVAASNAEVIRLRDQEQADREARRRAEVRVDAQRWLSEGQEVLARKGANDLEDAGALFAKASDVIDGTDADAEPALRELKAEAGRRLADVERRRNERAMASKAKADAQRWLGEGLNVLARKRANDLEDARVLFAKAADRIDDAEADAEPALRELKAEAGRRLAEVERQRNERTAAAKAESDYQQFFALRDEAFFQLYRDSFAGPDPASPAVSGQAARKALGVVGFDPQRPGAPSLDAYDAAKRERLVGGLYEVLLLLAEATARPMPNQPIADRQRQARDALQIMDRAAELAPATGAVLRRRARYLEQLGDAAGAAKERARADAAEPKTALDWFLTGFDKGQEGGDPRQAVADFDRAIRIQPDLFWAQFFRALSYEKLKNLAEARASLTVCIRDQPDFIWTYLLRGFLYSQSPNPEDLKAAEADYARAEELEKLHPDESVRYVIHANRGVLAVSEGDLDRAADDFQKAVDLKPGAYPAYLDLADAYQRQNELDKALAVLDAAIRLDPKSPLPWRLRASLHLLRKDEAAALDDLDRAVRLQSSAPPSAELAADQLARARILYRLKNYEEVIKACQAVLAVRADSARAYRLEGEALVQLKRFKEAAACFDRGVELGKARPDGGAYWDRGLVRMEQNDAAGAADDFTEALALTPSATERRKLHLARGRAYLTADAPKLALHDFEEALRVGGPQDEEAEAYSGRGEARVRLGQAQAAVADAEECARLAPDVPRLLYNAGRVYAQVVGRMDGGAGAVDGLPPAVRGYFQDRADALLRATLEHTPAAERASFWRKYVQVDPVWNGVRRSLAFAQLADAYREPGR